MKTLREESLNFINPSICAWCGTRQGMSTQEVGFIQRHFFSNQISNIAIKLPICSTCQSYNEERQKGHKKIQRTGCLVPVIIGAIIGLLMALSEPPIDVLLTVFATIIGALISGFVFGWYLKFLLTQTLIAVGLYDQLLDRISGSVPEGYVSVFTKDASRFPNPGELLNDSPNNWKINFYSEQFQKEFGRLNPHLVESTETERSSKRAKSLTLVRKNPSGHKDWIICSHCGARQYKSRTWCINCTSEFE